MKTLYVSDLDGTLLRSDKSLSERSIRKINDLIDRGMLFTYATGRSISSASSVVGELAVSGAVIVYNGTFVVDPRTREILISEGFTSDEVRSARAVFERFGIEPLVYSYVGGVEYVSWIIERETAGIQNYYRARPGDPRFRPLHEGSDLYEGAVFYFIGIDARERLLPLYEIFRQDERYTCILHEELYSKDYWFELMPRAATKGTALRHLKERWKCGRVVCFGDGVNDLSMFEEADECYAVENASEVLKQLATGVIGRNDDDAVAEWLERMFLRE